MNTKAIAGAALGLALIVPNTLVSGEYSSGKSTYYGSKDAAVFDESPYKVDLYGGASAVYNSNTTQLLNGTGAWVGVFDYGFDIDSSNQRGRGMVYNFGYDGAAYWWEDSAAAAGRDPLEHRLNGSIGVNGGKTRLRLSADYYRNNGNSMEWTNVDRESRAAQSHDFNLDASLVRDINRGSIEAGAGVMVRDFDTGFLNDQNSWYGDLAWFHNPMGMPKTNLGLGFRFGQDDYDSNVDQEYYTTSVRWRYQASAKTYAHASAGWENRQARNGAGDVDNFVFDLGVNWEASEKTNFDLYFARSVQPSYSGLFQSYESNGITARVNHDLPGMFVLAAHIGYENAEYFASGAGATPTATFREDDFIRAGVTLSHPVAICDNLDGVVSVFYNYNENDSTINLSDFDQSIAGLRFGFVY